MRKGEEAGERGHLREDEEEEEDGEEAGAAEFAIDEEGAWGVQFRREHVVVRGI